MTIFVNKNADKKEDSNSAPPEVVSEVKVCSRSAEKLMMVKMNQLFISDLRRRSSLNFGGSKHFWRKIYV